MMAQHGSGWQKLVGALAACLVALLILAPLADSFVCLTDDATPAAQSSAGFDTMANPSPVDADHAGGEPGLCTHGHCHHGASFVVAGVAADGSLSPLNGLLSPRHAAALVSIAAQRLDDPPRA